MSSSFLKVMSGSSYTSSRPLHKKKANSLTIKKQIPTLIPSGGNGEILLK